MTVWIGTCGTIGTLGTITVVHAETTRALLGLIVSPDGELLKDGKPFRGIGVNVFDLFKRTLADPLDTSYEQILETLAEYKIPFVRLAACGFWPIDMELYRSDTEAYFRRMDRVVEAAERHGVGLIPSIAWRLATIPDLVGEPVDQWGNPDSQTHRFLRTYTRRIVTRYVGSPAIWGWELGNEFNLAADLPNAAEHRPWVVPARGTPTTRTARDDLTHAMFRTAIVAFAEEVRLHDPHRMLSTGNSLPRASAWHQMHEGSWRRDTPEQSAQMLRDDNPDPCDTISVHWYEGLEDAPPYVAMEVAIEAAREIGKPLFVGEFGVPGPPTPQAVEMFAEMLKTIENHVPLSALWVFEFRHLQPDQVPWNVTLDNARAYQLHAIAEANTRLRAQQAEPATPTAGD